MRANVRTTYRLMFGSTGQASFFCSRQDVGVSEKRAGERHSHDYLWIPARIGS